MILHDYFKEFPAVVGAALKAEPEDRQALLKPLVEADNLFYRQDGDTTADRLVYIFLDGSRGITGKQVTEDWLSTHPVMYIGKGTIDRPLYHFWGDSEKVNVRFRDWLDYMKKQDAPVYLLIYSCGMSDREAFELEADLINLIDSRVQSLNTGIRIYKSKNAPIRMFNSKYERSNQRVYSTFGNRQRIPQEAVVKP